MKYDIHKTLNSFRVCVYIGKTTFEKLWQRGLQLITGIRRNMKNYLILWVDKVLLRKRFVIETVNGILKISSGIEHSRHRSVQNALVHILSCLVAYQYNENKPKITQVP